MGRASSAKKVARAARAGGTAKRERPKIAFPLAVFVIVVLGVSLVVFARTSKEPASAAPPSYLNRDHWHAAYGVYVCDAFLPRWVDVLEDRDGIHTHEDGIIHIHPFSASSSGTKAKMSVFAKQVGVTFTDDGFVAPDGTEYKDGYDCNGQPAKVSVFEWHPDDPTRPGDVFDGNFNNILFDADRVAYTIAVVPEGVTPPLPPTVPGLDNLVDVPSAGGAPTGAAGLDPSLIDPSQLAIDPATGAPIVPGSPTSPGAAPPVSDAASVPSGEPTPTPSEP